MKTSAGIHPKWTSCFPNGVHRWNDGITPDEEWNPMSPYELDADDLAELGEGTGSSFPPVGQMTETAEDRLERELRALGV
jgi:hypothetical protein